MDRISKRIASVLIALCLVVALLPLVTPGAQAADYTGLGLDGLNLSILGDSISTMKGVSCQGADPSAPKSNSTLPIASWSYDGYRQNVKQADTWWQQTADQTGMSVLVDNA